MTVTSTTINIFYIILSINFIFTQCKHTFPEMSPTMEAQLNRESRKAECCSRKMRCCKRRQPPPNVEIRAVIARCIDPPNICNKNRNIVKKKVNKGNVNNVQNFQGFDEDEPLIQSEVTKCARKLILTIKIRNNGETNTRNQFIIIDHVYDPLSDQTVRLLNPYVVKMKQEHVSQTYGLRFLDFVNSQAREQVYNKHDGNYTGCCTDNKRPTCGRVTFRGKLIPYSTGFCCSCDAHKNAERQPQTEPDPVIAYSDPAYLMDAVDCPRTLITENKFDLRKLEQGINETEKATSKDNQKRHMENDNVYYINPQRKYKYDHKKKKHPVDNRNQEFESEFGNSKLANNLGNAKSYKDMPDNQKNNFNNQKGVLQDSDKTSFSTDKNIKDEDLNIQAVNAKAKLKKPSVHKLLNSENMYFPDNIYGFKENMDKIADQAFKDAIKSQKSEDSDKKNLENDNGPSPQEAEFDLPENIYEKRQVQSSGVQRRGGQNCADRYTPPRQNPESYHESTHCLRFSPVWYGVYRLDKPLVEQEIVFQVFEKYDTQCGVTKWKDLTSGKKVRLGTFWPNYKDEVPTISMTFNSVFDDEDFCLDWNNLRLLIPEGLKISELIKYPEARGGAAEYLLVPNKKIILTGDQCDSAGVGFEAFFNQPNRCSMSKSSCLHHQPYHMWSHDKRMERNGKRGCYFLKHHGKLSKNPIRKNSSDDEKFLTLNYYGRYISLVDMEINADFNGVLRPTTSAIITEVYIDSTCLTRTFLTIKVSNSGLLSSKFMVRVCDCPLDLRGKLKDVQSEIVMIPPQHQHIFKLSVHVILHVDIFHCSVEVLNGEGELVALRRIKIQKSDRCICTWHCLCACIGSSTGLKCIPMTIDHYHAAGFKGALPTVTRMEHVTLTGDIFHLVLFILFFISFTLFMLGFTKALLGLCSLPIGMWGLNILLDLPKQMNRYYDKSLADRRVQYDPDGWPVHPDTGHKMRNIPANTEFCINILFFFTYPTVMFVLLLRRICCPFDGLPKKKAAKGDRKSWLQAHKCKLKSCLGRSTPVEADGDHESTTTVPSEKSKRRKTKKKLSEKSVEESEESQKENQKEDEIQVHKENEKDKQHEDQKENLKKNEKESQKKNRKESVAPNKRPTIKVSIKEHKKERDEPITVSSKKSADDASDNPYYYTSTEDVSAYSGNTPSSEKSNRSGVSKETNGSDDPMPQ